MCFLNMIFCIVSSYYVTNIMGETCEPTKLCEYLRFGAFLIDFNCFWGLKYLCICRTGKFQQRICRKLK